MNNQNCCNHELKSLLEERKRIECSTNLFEETIYEAYGFTLLFCTPFVTALAFTREIHWSVPVIFFCGAVAFGLLRLITSVSFKKTKQKKLLSLNEKISELNEI